MIEHGDEPGRLKSYEEICADKDRMYGQIKQLRAELATERAERKLATSKALMEADRAVRAESALSKANAEAAVIKAACDPFRLAFDRQFYGLGVSLHDWKRLYDASSSDAGAPLLAYVVAMEALVAIMRRIEADCNGEHCGLTQAEHDEINAALEGVESARKAAGR